MLSTVIRAIVSFVAVNLDEFAVLIVFFSQVDGREFKNIDVVLGQLIGFTIIFGISCFGYFFGLYLPLQDIALLGFLPIFIGLYQLYEVYNYWMDKDKGKSKNKKMKKKSNNKTTYETISAETDDFDRNLEESQLSEFNPEPSDQSQSDSDSDSSDEHNAALANYLYENTNQMVNSNTLLVVVTILADGSEEIGLFLPQFSVSNSEEMVITVITFYAMIGIQCYIASRIVQYKKIGSLISRYSKNVLPFLLIILGIYILKDSVLFQNM